MFAALMLLHTAWVRASICAGLEVQRFWVFRPSVNIDAQVGGTRRLRSALFFSLSPRAERGWSASRLVDTILSSPGLTAGQSHMKQGMASCFLSLSHKGRGERVRSGVAIFAVICDRSAVKSRHDSQRVNLIGKCAKRRQCGGSR